MPPIPIFEQKKVVSLFAVFSYALLAAGACFLVYRLFSLILPFIVATILAMTLIPEVDRLERKGMPRGVAIGIIYVMFLLTGGLMIKALTVLASDQFVSIFHNILSAKIAKDADMSTMVGRWMEHNHLPRAIRPILSRQAADLSAALATNQGWRQSLVEWIQNLVWVVIVPIITFFILLDFHKILGKLLILAPPERRTRIMETTTDIIAVFGNYVRGVCLVMVMDIVVIYVVLMVAGLGKYAPVLAITMGVLYTVPYFGALISTVAIGAVAWSVHGVGGAIAVTLVMILIHQVIFDNIVAPRVIGRSVNLHPLFTIFSLMAGYSLFQVLGALLAVPIAAAIQIVLVQVFPRLKTDEVTVRRAAKVVRATLATDTEANKPQALKDGSLGDLKRSEAVARDQASGPPPVQPGGTPEQT